MICYRVEEHCPARGDFLHFDRFSSLAAAEEYVEKIVRKDDEDMFGAEIFDDEDYDYTESPTYENYSILEDHS